MERSFNCAHQHPSPQRLTQKPADTALSLPSKATFPVVGNTVSFSPPPPQPCYSNIQSTAYWPLIAASWSSTFAPPSSIFALSPNDLPALSYRDAHSSLSIVLEGVTPCSEFTDADLDLGIAGTTASASKMMTPGDRDVMLQKRRIRNRRSAQRSRERSRAQTAVLLEENEGLKATVRILLDELRSLRERSGEEELVGYGKCEY